MQRTIPQSHAQCKKINLSITNNQKSRTFAASFNHPKLFLVGSNALIFGRK